MINECMCGYCGRQVHTLQALEEHLTNVRRHPVYSCCGRFFRQPEHYEQHKASPGVLNHRDTCVRREDV